MRRPQTYNIAYRIAAHRMSSFVTSYSPRRYDNGYWLLLWLRHRFIIVSQGTLAGEMDILLSA